jgi:MarR family transcriptional regulator, organic hydroperoxide resistance regulator
VRTPLPPEVRPEIDSIVEMLIYLYTESRRLTKGMASEFGLTGPQLTILKLLESFEDLSLSTLSERIRAQNSTVTGIVDRMEREGLVRRERSKADRRVVHIRLSEKGAKLAREIQVEPMEIFRGALLGLSPTDLRELLRILTKLQKHVLSRVAVPDRPGGDVAGRAGEGADARPRGAGTPEPKAAKASPGAQNGSAHKKSDGNDSV